MPDVTRLALHRALAALLQAPAPIADGSPDEYRRRAEAYRRWYEAERLPALAAAQEIVEEAERVKLAQIVALSGEVATGH